MTSQICDIIYIGGLLDIWIRKMAKLILLEHHIKFVIRGILISALLVLLSTFFLVEQYSLYDNLNSFLLYGLIIFLSPIIYEDASSLEILPKIGSSKLPLVIGLLGCLFIILWNRCLGLVLNSIFSMKILEYLQTASFEAMFFFEGPLWLKVKF